MVSRRHLVFIRELSSADYRAFLLEFTAKRSVIALIMREGCSVSPLMQSYSNRTEQYLLRCEHDVFDWPCVSCSPTPATRFWYALNPEVTTCLANAMQCQFSRDPTDMFFEDPSVQLGNKPEYDENSVVYSACCRLRVGMLDAGILAASYEKSLIDAGFVIDEEEFEKKGMSYP